MMGLRPLDPSETAIVEHLIAVRRFFLLGKNNNKTKTQNNTHTKTNKRSQNLLCHGDLCLVLVLTFLRLYTTPHQKGVCTRKSAHKPNIQTNVHN